MRIFLRVCILLFAVAPAVFAGPGAVRCGKLLDVRAGKELNDQMVVFDETGTITAVGPAGSATLPVGVTAIDLSGATCLPG